MCVCMYICMLNKFIKNIIWGEKFIYIHFKLWEQYVNQWSLQTRNNKARQQN